MDNAYVGEIRAFGSNFAPRGWAICSGQLLPIAQNTALFSILGTYYGGNGTTNFALPNLMGQIAVGTGVSNQSHNTYDVGQEGGSATVTLITTEMPAHTHTFNGGTLGPSYLPATTLLNVPSSTTYVSNIFAVSLTNPSAGTIGRGFANTHNAFLNPLAVGITGGSQPHTNMMPYLAITYCICLEGVFPARS